MKSPTLTATSSLLLSLLTMTLALQLVSAQDCRQLDDRFCGFAATSRYRTFDGSCNNVGDSSRSRNSIFTERDRAQWGMAGVCHRFRLLDPDFADYWGGELRRATDGSDLPNTRTISNLLATLDPKSPDLSSTCSQMVTNWGQITGNEMTYIGNVFREYALDKQTPCCVKSPAKQPKHPDCREVEVSPTDPYYQRFNYTCINYQRSPACTQCSEAPRQMLNMRTAFLDLGNLYSNILNDSYALRAFQGGRLAMDPKLNLLINEGKKEHFQCGKRWRKYYPEEKGLSCFRSGDSYGNNNAFKAALLNILARQHNRIAGSLARVNPRWNDEQLFYEARRILGAQQEIITYNEWLPLIMGPEAMAQYHLPLLKQRYTTYNPNMNPSVSIEWTIAGARSFGHSIATSETYRVLANGKREKVILKHFHYIKGFQDGWLDSFLRGIVTQPMKNPGIMMDSVLRNNAEGWAAVGHGSDILAIDLMRARDAGIASYTSYRKLCSGVEVTRFDQLSPLIPKDVVRKLQSVYKDVRDVDLQIGLMAESWVSGGLIGPTTVCLWGIQFARIKFGDRYFVEHGGQVGSFTPQQLRSLRRTLLSQIVCRNADHMPRIQRHVLLLPSSEANPLVDCDSLPDLDFEAWRDAGAQSVSAEGVAGLPSLALLPVA